MNKGVRYTSRLNTRWVGEDLKFTIGVPHRMLCGARTGGIQLRARRGNRSEGRRVGVAWKSAIPGANSWS